MEKFSEPKSYKVAIERLEEIVQALEVGNEDLENTYALYQEGKFLAKWCQNRLKSIENQIKIVDPAKEDLSDFELEL